MEEKHPNQPKSTKTEQKGKEPMRENKFQGWKEVFMKHAQEEQEPVKTNWLTYIDLYLFGRGLEIVFTRRNSKRYYKGATEKARNRLALLIRTLGLTVRAYGSGWGISL